MAASGPAAADRQPCRGRRRESGDLAVSGRAAAIDAKIAVQADKVADLNRQIADLHRV